MSEKDKQLKLIESICAIDGVKAAEAYKKVHGGNVWDVLVSLDNGRLVEQTLSSREDLAVLDEYIKAVAKIPSGSNVRSYPNCVRPGDVDEDLKDGKKGGKR